MGKEYGRKPRKRIVNVNTIVLKEIGRKLEVDRIHSKGRRSVSELLGMRPNGRKVSFSCSIAPNDDNKNCYEVNRAHIDELTIEVKVLVSEKFISEGEGLADTWDRSAAAGVLV